MVKLILIIFLSFSEYDTSTVDVKEVIVPNIETCEIVGKNFTNTAEFHKDNFVNKFRRRHNGYPDFTLTTMYECVPLSNN